MALSPYEIIEEIKYVVRHNSDKITEKGKPIALLSELYEHEKMLEAIEKKDCFAFLQYVNMNVPDLKEALTMVDEKTGKTLKMLLQESSLDFSRKQDIKINSKIMNITPLQCIFIVKGKGVLPNLYYFYLLVILGANINEYIDDEKNTLLHSYIKQSPHPAALEALLVAGGDIFLKNEQDKSPFDLADEATASYLLKLSSKEDKEHVAACKIQRQWRLRKNKNIEALPIKLEHKGLMPYAPIPAKTNPPNEEKMKLWIAAHKQEDQEMAKKVVESICHISYERFLFALKLVMKKFNKFLYSLPADERKYILLIDAYKEKSNPWVTKLAEKYLAFPPDNIIDTLDLKEFKPDIRINNIVYIDDASYSGNFLCTTQHFFYINTMLANPALMNLMLHFVVPFTTELARKKIQKYPVTLHTQEVIKNFKRDKGIAFWGASATYFDHKIPVADSTIECIANGKLINGNDSGILFVDPITPPYKVSP